VIGLLAGKRGLRPARPSLVTHPPGHDDPETRSPRGRRPGGLAPTAVGLALAVVLAAAVALAPLPLAPRAHRLAAIFVAVVVLWVTEALPIAATALLIAPLLVVFAVTDPVTAFTPYADPLLFIFVGGFFIARAMTRHGLDRRIAQGLLSSPGIHGSPARTRAALVVAGVVLSMWISNTATTAILVPITLGVFRGRAALGAVLTVAYACSLGGLGTVVGSPPNLITVRFLADAGFDLGFVGWMAVGLPMAMAGAVAVFVSLRETDAIASIGERENGAPADAPEARRPRPWTRGERVTALAFGTAVVGWIVPGVIEAVGGPAARALQGTTEDGRTFDLLPVGGVALFAASILFAVDDVPDRDGVRRRVLPWREANRIDWGIVMLFGGGISLGRQMFDTGLAEALARGFVQTTGVEGLWTLTALVTVFTIFFTEVCSNTASANMLAPLVIAVAGELEVSPIPPTLAVGLAASCAFMLPIATGPNAIAYGTGTVPLPAMMRHGLGLNLICAVLVFLLLRGLCPLLGWV